MSDDLDKLDAKVFGDIVRRVPELKPLCEREARHLKENPSELPPWIVFELLAELVLARLESSPGGSHDAVIQRIFDLMEDFVAEPFSGGVDSWVYYNFCESLFDERGQFADVTRYMGPIVSAEVRKMSD